MNTESVLMRRIRGLEDPRPHLNEAKEAFTEMLSLQKDLLLLEAETRTWNQIRRILFALGALMTFELAVGFSLFWFSWLLHENGVSAGILAIFSFLIFSLITAGLAWTALYYGQKEYQVEEDLE